MVVIARVVAASCLLIGVGCGTGSRSTIGSGGGQLSGEGATVVVPANALSAEVALTVATAADAPAVPGAAMVGAAITLGPEGQTFSAPVTVTLAFDPARLPAGKSTSDIVIYTAPAGSDTCVPLVTRVVDGTHVAADTGHFSTFVTVVSTAPPLTGVDSDQGW
jgi:ZU5 domain